MTHLKPEEKVNITMDLTDAATRITAQGIRDQNPGITETQVMEELRRRIAQTRRPRNEE
ncbi:MAG TPA: hypothetical protein VMW22_05760 [Candidatus Desulfaltia sp.]|nr:hypothetical protein [Candidatus Desulfaltia sp.]